MSVAELCGELTAALGFTVDRLASLAAPAKRKLQQVFLVHDIDRVFHANAELGEFQRLLQALDGTEIRIIGFSTRRVSNSSVRTIEIRQLRSDDMQIVVDYWCEALGVGTLDAKMLHGYPLAAKYAARLLKEELGRELDQLSFFKTVRRQIVEVLLTALRLTARQRGIIEVLCTFRRPVEASALDDFDVDGYEGPLNELEQMFLVERSGDQLSLNEMVREVAVVEWLQPAHAKALHETAAKYYSERIQLSLDFARG